MPWSTSDFSTLFEQLPIGAYRSSPDGRQLRVYNGIYLANWKLGRRDGATRAFGNLVDFGLESKKLAMSFLFRPGSTSFVADPKVSGAYPLWIKEIASDGGQLRERLISRLPAGIQKRFGESIGPTCIPRSSGYDIHSAPAAR